MELKLKIELDSKFAREIADKLGMSLIKVDKDNLDLIEISVTDEEVQQWLENHMKETMVNIYSDIVKDIKLAELNKIKEREENNIKNLIKSAIQTGSI